MTKGDLRPAHTPWKYGTQWHTAWHPVAHPGTLYSIHSSLTPDMVILMLDNGDIEDLSWTLATLEINLGHWRHWRLILDIGDIMRNVSGLAISQPRSMRLWLKVRKAIEWEICHAWGFEMCLRVWNMFEGLKYVWGFEICLRVAGKWWADWTNVVGSTGANQQLPTKRVADSPCSDSFGSSSISSSAIYKRAEMYI